ncbi:hypothetical protein [Nibribacter koreensis]|uniref:ABC-2 family transporter protein n=1 Tax=Nibribacter koreensis TaxID=1084519 RepID=A0ABP8FCJ8_9BACT
MQFNFSRFWRLFIKHTAEHYKFYLMATAVLAGIMALITTFVVTANPNPISLELQVILFAFILFASGSIFTSSIFSDLGDKKKAIATLSLPASHLEKYLVGWVYSTLIFFVVFLACFYAVFHLIVPMDNWMGQEPQILNVLSFDHDEQNILLVFLFLHAIAFWGSITFEKWHFIKTAFLFFVIMISLIFINENVMEGLIGREVENASPFSNVTFFNQLAQDRREYFKIELPEARKNLLAIVPVGMALLLWLTAFLKLKEKEV